RVWRRVALCVASAGIGKVFLDVSGSSLLQRTVPAEQRSRVLGLLEGMVAAALAAGPVAASVLVVAFGAPGALVVAGAIPIVFVVLAWPVLSSADAASGVPEPQFRLLSGVPMFRPLQLTTIEGLANAARHVQIEAATDGVRQGGAGDTFFIVVAGRLEVVVDGRVTGELGPGDSLGEIALLRDV